MSTDHKKKKRDSDGIAFMEKIYPFSFSFLIFVIEVIVFSNFTVTYSTAFDNVLNAVITFSSILVGFVGVLLGLLFSIINSKIVKKIFKHSAKTVLKSYFMTSMISGILLIFLSILLFLRNSFKSPCLINFLNISFSDFLTILWGALIVYVLLSTWRIVSIIMHILFSDDIDNNETQKIDMDKNEEKELQQTYKKV